MLLSLLRNNTSINNKGSGAECPHTFGQAYTVWAGFSTLSCVTVSRVQTVTAGSSWVRSGRRGGVSLGTAGSGGHVQVSFVMGVTFRYVMSGSVRAVEVWQGRLWQLGLRRSGHGPFWSGRLSWGAAQAWSVLVWRSRLDSVRYDKLRHDLAGQGTAVLIRCVRVRFGRVRTRCGGHVKVRYVVFR